MLMQATLIKCSGLRMSVRVGGVEEEEGREEGGKGGGGRREEVDRFVLGRGGWERRKDNGASSSAWWHMQVTPAGRKAEGSGIQSQRQFPSEVKASMKTNLKKHINYTILSLKYTCFILKNYIQ